MKIIPVFVLAIALLLTSCSVYAPYHWWTISYRDVLLEDCTESIAEAMAWDVPQVPELDRQRLVAAASAWGEDNCYVPCEYKMCATITEYGRGTGTVYISHDLAASADAEEVVVGPEAYVTFDLQSWELKKRGVWNTGCRTGAEDCSIDLD